MKINHLDFEETLNLDSKRLDCYSVEENYQFNFVYILFDGKEVVYVGQSRNHPNGRIQAHIKGSKVFDRFAIIKVESDYDPYVLNNSEASLIMQYKPKYNKHLPPNTIWVRRNKLATACGIHHKTLKKGLKSIFISSVKFGGISYFHAPKIKKALKL